MRTPSIASVYYVPDNPPTNQEDFNRYVFSQLNKISAAVSLLAAGHIDKTYAAPSKPRDGDIRYADGTTWNPTGAGAGIYYFNGTIWKILG